jgi:hypothetical protein
MIRKKLLSGAIAFEVLKKSTVPKFIGVWAVFPWGVV